MSERTIAEIIGWTLPDGAPYIDTRYHDAISIVTVDDLLAWLLEREWPIEIHVHPHTGVMVAYRSLREGRRTFRSDSVFAALEAAVRAVDGGENGG